MGSAAGFIFALLLGAHGVAEARECPKSIQNWHLCSRHIESNLAKQHPGLFKRTGKALRISLRNGKTKILRDFEQGDDVKAFSLTEYFPDNGYGVIDIALYEGHNLQMISLRDGKLTNTGGYPVLSPDKKRFAVAEFGSVYDYGVLAVYRISEKGLIREYSTRSFDWGYGNVKWRSSTSFSFGRARTFALGSNAQQGVLEQSPPAADGLPLWRQRY